MVGLGLRNPWRFSFDRANGDLYIGDVGQNAWEEIDYRARAQVGTLANYGWKTYEGRARFSNTALGPDSWWRPSTSTAMTAATARDRRLRLPRQRRSAAAGRYFFGDYCSGDVWSLRVENGHEVDVRREPFQVPSLTTFGEDAAGELYAGTDNGRIFKLAS